ncbi:hypothetical protein PM082_022041 [Marasmius tenuissimus]|nr:hypothetical protein PM082_022041 [Marasmius tenuissimus]
MPEEHCSLTLPQGYDIISSPRNLSRRGSNAGGGVTIIYKSQIRPLFKVRSEFNAEDLIVLDFPSFFLVGAYLPPENSTWARRQPVQPKDRLEEVLQVCASSPGKNLIVCLDANARTAQLSSSDMHTRTSKDMMCNPRGRWLIRIAKEMNLTILNGTDLDSNSPGMFTSFHGGFATVDYIMMSAPLLSTITKKLVTQDRFPESSDHSTLSLSICFDRDTPVAEHSNSTKPNYTPGEPTFLDLLMKAALEEAVDNRGKTLRLYGSATSHTPPVSVHIQAVTGDHYSGQKKACFGVYWGPNCTRTVAQAANGRQTVDRAILSGIIQVLESSDPANSLRIHLSSEHLIHTLNFRMGVIAEDGWIEKDADLLRKCTALIMRRSGSIDWQHKDPSFNNHSIEARNLAFYALHNQHTLFV